MTHLFVSDSDGALYDTRAPDWPRVRPLRAVYRRTFTWIRNLSELKATLRNGAFAWPGGYPLFFIMADGAPASFDGVRANWRSVVEDMRAGYGDWRVVACQINHEDTALTCDLTGDPIPSAYGEN